MNDAKTKSILVIIGIAILFLLIIVLVAKSEGEKEDKNNFPSYDNFSIKESDVKDSSSESYTKIKERLESDYYFGKSALISNYNYKNYTSSDLQQMVWNYIFAYELNNKKYLSNVDAGEGTFCMRSRYVIDSFEELYGVKITKDIDYLDGYYEYVKSRNNLYCFNYGNVARDYSNDIRVLVEELSEEKNVITANIYLYEYYTTDTELELSLVDELEKAIKKSNSIKANEIVKEQLNGRVTHKQLQFKINNSGDFFKYQILNSKNLSY